MNRTKALDLLKDAINDKVEQNWNDGTNVTNDIAALVRLAKECGLIDDWQAKQLFHEAHSGYQITCSLLFELGLTK